MRAEEALAEVARTGRGRRIRRLALMLVVPLLVLLAGGWWWMFGGRWASTDNAYVHQDIVQLSADVAGRITEVAARENQHVTAGETLFRLDDRPYRIALQQDEAAIAAARLEVEQYRAAYQQALAERTAAAQNLDFRKRELDRQAQLATGGYAAQARLDEVRNDFSAAQQRVAAAEQGVAKALAELGGDAAIATDDHPMVREALAKRDQARLDLEHTSVQAPADGVISQADRLLVGQYILAGMPVVSLVETDSLWVEANFKETDLTHMRTGQAAEITIDAFPDLDLAATVTSIGAGTGAEFSVLPAQNATGNWVKVVQRVPVRLHLASPEAAAHLRAGLSATVAVDTGWTRPWPSPIRSALAFTGLGPAD
ncbi:MAG: HlyD family secretion protein [Geminicoccaceae bacterium]